MLKLNVTNKKFILKCEFLSLFSTSIKKHIKTYKKIRSTLADFFAVKFLSGNHKKNTSGGRFVKQHLAK